MAAFDCVYRVTGATAVTVFAEPREDSASIGVREPEEDVHVSEVKGAWLRVKATATSKGGWVTGAGEGGCLEAVSGAGLLPQPARRGSYMLKVHHPSQEKLVLGEIAVAPEDTLAHCCALVETLTGLCQSKMIPIEGIKAPDGMAMNFPKINWIPANADKTVREAGYENGEQFMFTYLDPVCETLKPELKAMVVEDEEEQGEGNDFEFKASRFSRSAPMQ